MFEQISNFYGQPANLKASVLGVVIEGLDMKLSRISDSVWMTEHGHEQLICTWTSVYRAVAIKFGVVRLVVRA